MEISVVIPVYNAERFLAEAVASALDQPETAEVILIDDGSSDGSLEIGQSLAQKDKRIRVLQHPDGKNRGAAATRNLGLRSTRSPYVAFLDADDLFLPGRFAKAREILEARHDVDGVYDAVGTRYETEAMADWWCDTCRQPEVTTVTKTIEPEVLFEALVQGRMGRFCTDGVTVRSKFFQRVGLFDTDLRIGEDLALWIKMAALGRLVGGSIDEPVALRRLHGANTIYVRQEETAPYAVQMGQSLIRWGQRNRLGSKRMLLLVESVLEFRDWHRNTASSPPGRLAELRFLTGLLATCPCAWRSRRFRQRFATFAGWRRLSGGASKILAKIGVRRSPENKGGL